VATLPGDNTQQPRTVKRRRRNTERIALLAVEVRRYVHTTLSLD
jgi:hypothetical protein